MTLQSPHSYAQLAVAAERLERWAQAAEYWKSAERASQGHHRRARYAANAATCLLQESFTLDDISAGIVK